MPWIVLSMLVLAAMFTYFGWSWERNASRPETKKWPMVSVLIPHYKNPHVKQSVESAKNLDYPNKEIIVVSDSETPPLEGVRVIQNEKRLGKSRSLNLAVKDARGEILFFMDSDTVADADTLKKLVPWFSSGVGAVSPKFIAKNRDNLITKLISLEHQFISSLFKIQMYLGSLISFRGCGVAIKKDVFLKLGGWKDTTIEDTDLAATMVSNGYKIMFDPEAVVRTMEPDTWSEYKRQRSRWGRGTGFSFMNHWRFYLKNIQFGLYIFPYLLLFLAVGGFLLYNTSVYLIPLASLYLVYTISIKEFLFVFLIFLVSMFSNVGTSLTAAGIGHFAIVTNSERSQTRDLILTIPYVMIFLPLTMMLYIRGIFSSISDKRNRRGELNLNKW